jgi:fatty-acyl-CoA synthase
VTAVGKIYKPALQMIEIGIVVRNEASNLGLADVEVNVVQDTRRGLVAKIYAPQDGERLAAALGRYTFHIEWDQPSTVATTPERRDQQ